MQELFAWLDGSAPLYWVSFGILLLIIELLTGSFFLIGIGIAAVIMAIIVHFVPDMQGVYQAMLFAVASLVLTLIAWKMRKRIDPDTSDAPGLNKRSDAAIGRIVTVSEPFVKGSGAVSLDDVRWQALFEGAEAPKVGDKVRVSKVRGTVLTVVID